MKTGIVVVGTTALTLVIIGIAARFAMPRKALLNS